MAQLEESWNVERRQHPFVNNGNLVALVDVGIAVMTDTLYSIQTPAVYV